MTNIGKPYEGKPHVRFDEERLVVPAFHSTRQGCRQVQARGRFFCLHWIKGKQGEDSLVPLSRWPIKTYIVRLYHWKQLSNNCSKWGSHSIDESEFKGNASILDLGCGLSYGETGYTELANLRIW